MRRYLTKVVTFFLLVSFGAGSGNQDRCNPLEIFLALNDYSVRRENAGMPPSAFAWLMTKLATEGRCRRLRNPHLRPRKSYWSERP